MILLNKQYLVCVRCFSFNHASYIIDTLHGFTMQETTFPYVCVIVDDASTDGEQKVIRQFLDKHFKDPFYWEETDDYSLICTESVKNANCTFIVFLLKYNHFSIKKPKMPYLSKWLEGAKYHAICEGDDYWTSNNKIQKQYDYLEEHLTCGLVYSKAKIYDEQSETFSGTVGNGNHTFSEMLMSNPIPTLTVMYRAELYRNYLKEVEPSTKGWRMGDYPLWLYIASKRDLYFIDEAMAVYRANQGSASRPKDLGKKLKFLESTKSIRLFFCERYGTSTSKTLIEQDYEESCIKAAIAYKEKIQGLYLLTSAKNLSFSQKVRLLWAIIRN